MTTIRCDECGEILDKKKDKYYTIGEIEYHCPGDKDAYVFVQKYVDKGTKTDRTHSWVDYCDLHFCKNCLLEIKIADIIHGGIKKRNTY